MSPEEIAAVAGALGRDVTGVRTLAGGFSHETCLLELGTERVVARLGGRDPAIEAAVMAVARRHVPVPEVLHVLPGADDNGTRPAMVLEFAAGTPLSEVLSGDEAADGNGMRDLGAEVGRVFGRIGRVTFGRPGFFGNADLVVGADQGDDMGPWSQQLPVFAVNCMAAVPESRLDPVTRDAWTGLCREHAPALRRIDDQACLVHADANPKNVLVTKTSEGWRVDAVLDWEFSFSGCPFADAANMTRFGDDYPPGFTDGFYHGFGAAQDDNSNKSGEGDNSNKGGAVYLGRVLDMFALSDLVTRPAGHPVAGRAAAEIRRWIADGVPDSIPATSTRATP